MGKPVPAVEFLRGGAERSIVVVSPQPAPAPPECLAALTVLANYFHRRRDGSTAAERFFGVPPAADLFEWLVSHVSSPPRPAARRQAA